MNDKNVMDKNERVAVIMSAYNEREKWLRDSIQSILNQTYRNIHFYIVLDNPDNKEIRDILLSYKASDERITVIENEKNLGLVKSLNKAISCVTEKYTARMDADDVSAIDRIEKEMKFLLDNKLDFVMTNARFMDEESNVSAGNDIRELKDKEFKEFVKYANPSIHSSWLMKTSVYHKLGGYREVKYCEDYDFLLRALQRGVKAGHLCDSLLDYRLRKNGITISYAREQYEKSSLLMKLYVKGKDIAKVEPDFLNEKFSGYSKKQIEAFSKAKCKIDAFCIHLYKHEYLQCLLNCLGGFIVSNQYRRQFIKAIYSRIKLSGIK